MTGTIKPWLLRCAALVSVVRPGLARAATVGLRGLAPAGKDAARLAPEDPATVRRVEAALDAYPVALALVKRVVDLGGAAFLLCLMAPMMGIVAVLVRAEDGGPVLYRQLRVGQAGIPFTLIKFRSMRVDAEAGERAVRVRQNDARITPVGRFLRATRIDELPQLVNVLRGEMSLVGPRPELPEIVAELIRVIPNYDLRHRILPGITGWAQINYPHGTTVEDAVNKTRLDLHYLTARGFWLDVRILLSTVAVVLAAQGR